MKIKYFENYFENYFRQKIEYLMKIEHKNTLIENHPISLYNNNIQIYSY